MQITLEGKNALVCGSTDGIGKATAIVLAEMGANITLLSRNEEKLQKTLQELDTSIQGQKHQYIVADFFQPEQVTEAIKEHLGQQTTPFHILINNTGGPPLGPLIEKSSIEIIKYMSLHLTTFHILAQSLIPGMNESGYGRIVNISSNAAKQPLLNMGISNTIRGAISGWAKTLANELGPNITVNNILPGPTDTKELRNIIAGKAEQSGRSIEEVYGVLHSKVPLGRLGSPREIANVVAFIASPLASFVNGTNIVVDGGKTGSL